MEKEKIKVLWISDLVVPTGFSRVSHSIIYHLSPEEYEVRGLGINYKGDPQPYPYMIFPANIRGNDAYGISRLEEIIEYWTPDIIFILNDAWIVRTYLKEIKRLFGDKTPPKIVTYIPVDSEDHSPSWYKEFDTVDKIVTYTEFGKKVIRKAAPLLTVSVIPHGVEHEDFFKIQGVDKRLIKKQILPDREDFLDSFIVLNANRNQPRKRIDLTIQGFAEFVKGKPENIKMYLHMGRIDQHIDILEYADRYDLGDRLIVTNTRNGAQAAPVALLNLIYNSCEVGINTGIGEGWGLPNFEHASLGAPQVVAGHSALKELYSDCGVIVKPKFTWTQDNIMTTGRVVTAVDVAEGLDKIYSDKELYKTLSEKSFEKFNSPEYNWKTIAGTWNELFKSLM